MDIGEPQRVFIIEPLQLPEPLRQEPAPEREQPQVEPRLDKQDKLEHRMAQRTEQLYKEALAQTTKERQVARAEWSELSKLCNKLRQEIEILEAEKHGRTVAGFSDPDRPAGVSRYKNYEGREGQPGFGGYHGTPPSFTGYSGYPVPYHLLPAGYVMRGDHLQTPSGALLGPEETEAFLRGLTGSYSASSSISHSASPSQSHSPSPSCSPSPSASPSPS